MPNDLINTDPIVAQNFFLEIDGEVVSILSSVVRPGHRDGGRRPCSRSARTARARSVKTLARRNKAPDLSLTRMAPPDTTQDKLWGWFNDIRDKGILLSDRTNNRKNGSIVMYDSTHAEVARFNFTNGWPSKISHRPAVSVDSNDPVKETITLIDRAPGAGQVSLHDPVRVHAAARVCRPRGRRAPDRAMRLATARDELEPLRDPTVNGPDDPRLTVLSWPGWSRSSATCELVTPHEIEGLFAADLAFLQDFYGVINFGSQEEYEALLRAPVRRAAVAR